MACYSLSLSHSDLYLMKTLVGSKGVWRGLANLVHGALSKGCSSSGVKRKLSIRWRVEGLKKGGVCEYEKQGGSHELKEKERGDDLDSHIHKVMNLPSESDRRTNLVPWQ